MGFLKKLIDKITKGFIYIVDMETFKAYLERELKFSLENNLEASADVNVYMGAEKNHIQIWNYSASEDEEERKKGVVIYFNDEEFASIDEMIYMKLNFLPQYFKIELTLADEVVLNEYKAAHPELREEDYQ